MRRATENLDSGTSARYFHAFNTRLPVALSLLGELDVETKYLTPEDVLSSVVALTVEDQAKFSAVVGGQ